MFHRQVKTLRELNHSVISHYYWGAGTSSGVQPKHVRVRTAARRDPLYLEKMFLPRLFFYFNRVRTKFDFSSCGEQLLLSSGGELDDRAWQQYIDRVRSRRSGPLRREDMLLCFAKRLDYDTVESGRDTSDSSISTMQIDGRNPKRATAPPHAGRD
jgi:hypothetical protein